MDMFLWKCVSGFNYLKESITRSVIHLQRTRCAMKVAWEFIIIINNNKHVTVYQFVHDFCQMLFFNLLLYGFLFSLVEICFSFVFTLKSMRKCKAFEIAWNGTCTTDPLDVYYKCCIVELAALTHIYPFMRVRVRVCVCMSVGKRKCNQQTVPIRCRSLCLAPAAQQQNQCAGRGTQN